MRQLILVLKLIIASVILCGVAVAFHPAWRIPGGLAVAVVVFSCSWLLYVLEYRKESGAAALQTTADKKRQKFEDRTTQAGDQILKGVGEIKSGLDNPANTYAQQRKYELAGKVTHLTNQIAKRLRELRANFQTVDEDYAMRGEINRIGGEFDSAILEAITYFPKLQELKIAIVRVKDDVFEAWRIVNDWEHPRYMSEERITAEFDKHYPIAHFNEAEDDETTLRIRKAVSDIRAELASYLD